MFIPHALAVVLAALPLSQALSQLDLRQRSIYQVLTDRFERGDGQNTYCDPSRREYCGGTWKGTALRLNYIQEMGFDTGTSRRYSGANGSLDIACGSQYRGTDI
jgi:alpha-amylase